MTNRNFMDVEDLEVYKKLCGLPIDVCDLTHKWPQEEKYELGSQSRRSSNSAPAQLAEKNKVPERERRWQLAEETAVYGVKNESFTQGWPITTEHVS